MMEVLYGFLPIINDRKSFALATTVIDSLSIVPHKIQIHDSTYVIIITRGHLHDKDVLKHALKTNAKYIKMIRSKRNETPAEIALSIPSEFIKVRRQPHDV